MTTTVAQLRDLLDGLDDDTEVRLMSQPSWPFEYSVLGTWTPQPKTDACGECGLPEESEVHGSDGDHDMEDGQDFEPNGAPASGVVYLVEGQQLAYGTKGAWDEVERGY